MKLKFWEIKMKKIRTMLVYTILAFLNFVANFSIYNLSFIKQATPYLQEEQRVNSALMMFQTTIPAYVISSILLACLSYLVATFVITGKK